MSTAFPLPTACISYNAKDRAFVPAAAAVAAASASASAARAGGGKALTAAAAVSTNNPLVRVWSRLEVVLGMLGLVMGCFIWGV